MLFVGLSLTNLFNIGDWASRAVKILFAIPAVVLVTI